MKYRVQLGEEQIMVHVSRTVSSEIDGGQRTDYIPGQNKLFQEGTNVLHVRGNVTQLPTENKKAE